MSVSFTGAKDIGTANFLLAPLHEYRSELRVLATLTNEGKPDLDNFREILNRFKPKVKNVLQLDVYTKRQKSIPFGDDIMFTVNGVEIAKTAQSIPFVRKLIEFYEGVAHNIKDEYTASIPYAKRNGFVNDSIEMLTNEKELTAGTPAICFHYPEQVKARIGEAVAKLKLFIVESYKVGIN